jgi:hypothetical protein
MHLMGCIIEWEQNPWDSPLLDQLPHGETRIDEESSKMVDNSQILLGVFQE